MSTSLFLKSALFLIAGAEKKPVAKRQRKVTEKPAGKSVKKAPNKPVTRRAKTVTKTPIEVH